MYCLEVLFMSPLIRHSEIFFGFPTFFRLSLSIFSLMYTYHVKGVPVIYMEKVPLNEFVEFSKTMMIQVRSSYTLLLRFRLKGIYKAMRYFFSVNHPMVFIKRFIKILIKSATRKTLAGVYLSH
jgi:hypothetical protein